MLPIESGLIVNGDIRNVRFFMPCSFVRSLKVPSGVGILKLLKQGYKSSFKLLGRKFNSHLARHSRPGRRISTFGIQMNKELFSTGHSAALYGPSVMESSVLGRHERQELANPMSERVLDPSCSIISEAVAPETKLDIRKLSGKDDVMISTTPVLRVKSACLLSRQDWDSEPLLRGQQRRGPLSRDDTNSLPSAPIRQHSFREDVGHAAAETYLITRLSFTLLRYLGLGYRWITKLMALGLYALFLMPGFIQVGWYYFFSNCVHRSIVYGDHPRNRLDLYIPEDVSGTKPVVIFVTGGAWIIGYKAWGALFGRQLVERDIIVACIDYRNFPQGGVSDMVEDVATGISFVVNNIANYGGDPDRIFLAGQSAGAHLAACALVEQAKKEIGEKSNCLPWSVTHMKAFMGLSGGYNLCTLVDHFHNRGLYRSIFLSVMEGEISLPRYSPELTVQSAVFSDGVALLPPIFLFHGTADYSIPHSSSAKFAEALEKVGANVSTRFYLDKTHTDIFLQDPLRGGRDPLMDDVLAIVHAGDEEALAADAAAPLRRRLVPEPLLRLARFVSPF